MGNNKLTGGVDGVRGKVEGSVVQAMPSRQRRVGFEGADVVKGEFDVGKEVRPAVGRKRDVDSRHNRDDVWFWERRMAVRIDRSAGRERWFWGGTYW